MEIIDLSKNKEIIYRTSVALGNFDGIHLGHQELIKTMILNAKELDLQPSLLLFKNHTKETLDKSSPKSITSIDQKLSLVKKLGVELIFFIDFNENLMKLSADQFVKEILLKKLKSELIVIGYDYSFGYKALGDSDYMKRLSKEFHFKLKVLSPVKKNDTPISSSYIRDLIEKGSMQEVEESLNRPYSIIGRVIRGASRGTKLGFPTANIELTDNYVIPRTGVYKTFTEVEGEIYKSATNIGYNPTFNKDNNLLKFETYILDFNKDIYGKTIEIFFKRHLRDDIKFDNKNELVNQMRLDIKEIENED